MWKPLTPVALLQRSKATETSKSSHAKVIQIEARPLPAAKSRSRPSSVTISPEVAWMDHDYCLPSKDPAEPVKRWNIKQQSFITIKPIKTTTQIPQISKALSVQSATNAAVTTKTQHVSPTKPLDHRTDDVQSSSVLETPDASPAWQEAEATVKEEGPKMEPFRRNYRQHAASRSTSPRSSSKERTGGQSRKRASRSPSSMSSGSESDSSSSRSQSRSHSPSKKRFAYQSRFFQLFSTPIFIWGSYDFPFWYHPFSSSGIVNVTLVVPALHPVLPLGRLCPALPPEGGGTLIPPLVLAHGVAPGRALNPLRDNQSGVEAGDCTGTLYK